MQLLFLIRSRTRWAARWKFPTAVKRIVSLAPNLTEIVISLGEGDHLAGDTDFCDYPAEATRETAPWADHKSNLEQVVALAPTWCSHESH